MTGNNCLRSADDIGSQELSYAEVKAIASGNPAVLTLAETDAELQRLLVLRKNHVDDQYLIRRKLKELPETIERLSTRLTHLSHDQATFSTQDHPDFRIDGQAVFREDAIERIASRLDRLPEHVSQATSIDLGEYHGIRFGIQINPFGPREVYLTGAAHQTVTLSREHAGPRAVMNALSRLADSFEAQRVRIEQDLVLSKQQLSDYQDRFGAVFPHEAYVTELTRLRDRLKLALSGGEANKEAAEQLNASQLANQIQELRQSQAPDVSSKRDVGQVQQAGEMPVTTRVRRHLAATPSETERNPRFPDVEGQEAHVVGGDASGTHFRDKVTLIQHERELAI